MKTELLRAEMQKRGLNQRKLAELADLPEATLSRIINGERLCGVRIAAKIVNAMKLKPKIATEIFFED